MPNSPTRRYRWGSSLGLCFGRVLVLLNCSGLARHDRDAAALGHKRAFGLAARLDGSLIGGPVAIELPRGFRFRDKASSPTNAVHTAAVKVGFITRLSGNFRSTPAASQPQRGREALPRLAAATWSPQLLTGSRIMFSICA